MKNKMKGRADTLLQMKRKVDRMNMKGERQRLNKILGNKIRMLRDRLSMEQMELAFKLGYNSSGAISMIETGKRGMGHDKKVLAAQILGVHPVVLLSPIEYNTQELDLLANLSLLMDRAPKSEHLKTIKLILETAVKELPTK